MSGWAIAALFTGWWVVGVIGLVWCGSRDDDVRVGHLPIIIIFGLAGPIILVVDYFMTHDVADVVIIRKRH